MRERYQDKFRYDHSNNIWFIWNGSYWAFDGKQEVMNYCRLIATSLVESKSSQRYNFFKGVEKIAQTDPVFSTTQESFDRDNYLLNTPDGTFDLRKNVRYDARPEDMITNITSVGVANDYGVRFPRFLDEITLGDKELANFLQVTLGATLSGAIESHWILFWIGKGRNGKNTLGDAVQNILGSYSIKIAAKLLMKTKFEEHPTEIAQLKGRRLAIGSEVEASAFWNEAKLNELTGDEKLNARVMRGNPFSFLKTFKFLIYGNSTPRLTNVTTAIKERIKLVPFKADFSKKADPDLPAQLRSEYPNILRWLIDGHAKWIEAGKKLPACKAVDDELNEYFGTQSTPEVWMAEYLQPANKATAFSNELYRAYCSWKLQRNEQPVSQSMWASAMKLVYGEPERSKKGMRYRAILVEHDFLEDDEEAENDAKTEAISS
jgi:putative DNA primase/helicase